MKPKEKVRFTLWFWLYKFFPLDNRNLLNRNLFKSLLSRGDVSAFVQYVESVYEKYQREETEKIIRQIEQSKEEERKFYLGIARTIIEKSDNQKKDLRDCRKLFDGYGLTDEINEIYKELA
jgi:hypothetical protein